MERTQTATRRLLGVFSVLTLALIVLSSLFIYKWSAAFGTITKVQSAGALHARTPLIATDGLPFLAASGARTVNYLATVWPALVFGVLIGGLVRAFVSPKLVASMLGSGVMRQQVMGGIVGMPLMLCSCCIAPIFSSVKAGGARLGSSLALMLSSPSLNPAALLLTFLLFPLNLAWARFGMAAFGVFILPVVIERLARGEASSGNVFCPSERPLPGNPIQVMGRWAVSSGTVAMNTLPLVILGVFSSALLVGAWQPHSAPAVPAALLITLVALFATLIALPTFFEIPFALLLLANGFPTGAVAALLFAGPAINLPSLLTLGRVSSRKVALVAFLGVWATATLGGLLVQSWRV